MPIDTKTQATCRSILLLISIVLLLITLYKLSTAVPSSYAKAVALAEPAVVSITTSKKVPLLINPLFQNPFFRQFFGSPAPEKNDLSETEQDLGSGVIVDKEGYILTNYHLIKEVDTVMVALSDGRKAEGSIVGSDPETDLAVVKIQLKNLPTISIGSSKALRPGDIVLAIGNAFGLEKTVTSGIISATERSGASLGLLENLLQTDAAINPGNSGGALIDTSGKLVGINTAIYSESGGSQGIGFAIPIDQATEVMQKLIAGIQIRRGFLGVSLQAMNSEIQQANQYSEETGVYIRAIVKGSPAEKSGLLAGDIISKINHKIIHNEREALQVITSLEPDQSYDFEIFRNGKYLNYRVVLAERQRKAS